MSSGPPTIPADPPANVRAHHAERIAFGLDAMQDEGRRLVAFGFEMLAAGGYEVCPGDVLDINA